MCSAMQRAVQELQLRDEHGTQVKALMEEQRRQQHELLQVRNATQHGILDRCFHSALQQYSVQQAVALSEI